MENKVSAPVSIAMPCWKRSELLAKTLESIRRQNYPGLLDLIVVEDDQDGKVEEVAAHYGARYLFRKRTDYYPPFQSTSKIWNMCLGACENDISILQTDDILHESPNVIADCVTAVEASKQTLVMPVIKSLKADGSFDEWFSHPPKDGGGERLSGTGPHAFWRTEMVKTGGYEELFYGYGYDDNFFFYTLKMCGWTFKHLTETVCAHQFHDRLKYEPITGFANRALCRLLILEIEEGTRSHIANQTPLTIDLTAKESDVDSIIDEVRNFPRRKPTLLEFEANVWDKDREYNAVAQAHRDIACERSVPMTERESKTSIMDELICECAWGLVRARTARMTAMEVIKEGQSDWPRIMNKAADITHTWASVALAKARKLRDELK